MHYALPRIYISSLCNNEELPARIVWAVNLANFSTSFKMRKVPNCEQEKFKKTLHNSVPSTHVEDNPKANLVLQTSGN